MFDPWKIVTIYKASYCCIAFVMYGMLAAAKNTAPPNTIHGSQCPQGLHMCAEAQLAAKNAATRVHHMFPAMEPAVAPNENPRSTEPFGERLRRHRKLGHWNVLTPFACHGGSCFTAWCSLCGSLSIETGPQSEHHAVKQDPPWQANGVSTFQCPSFFINVAILEENRQDGCDEDNGRRNQSARGSAWGWLWKARNQQTRSRHIPWW